MMGKAARGLMPSRLTRMRQGAIQADAQHHESAQEDIDVTAKMSTGP